MKGQIERSLRRAVSQFPRADFSSIKNAEVIKMQENDYITRQDEKTDKAYSKKRPLFAAASLAVVFIVCISIWGHQNWLAFGLITLDANPGFEITVNRNEAVIKVEGVNVEAQMILNGRNYRGWSIDDTIATLCEGMLNGDYLNATNNIILISVSSSGDTVEILNRLTDDLAERLPQQYAIIGQEITADREIQNEARQYSITQGKMYFISILADSLPDYSYAELAAMSLAELLDLIREEDIDTGNEAIAEIISEANANDAAAEIAALLIRMNEIYYRLAELYASGNYQENAGEINELQTELLGIYEILAGYSYYEYDAPPEIVIPNTPTPDASESSGNNDTPAEIAALLTRMNEIYYRLAELYADANYQNNAKEISDLQAELKKIYAELASYSNYHYDFPQPEVNIPNFDYTIPQPEVIIPSIPYSATPHNTETYSNGDNISGNEALIERIDEIHDRLAVLYTNENYYQNMQEVHELQAELSALYAELGYEYGSYYSGFNR